MDALPSGSRSPFEDAVASELSAVLREALDALPERLAPLGPHLQSLGVAGLGDRLDEIAAACARAGVTRVTDFRSMPFPPAWWLHDGRGPLTELIRWAEMEGD